MTEPQFRTHPYLREAEAVVLAHTAEGGIVLDRSLFYPTGGGQPGDAGWLHWPGQRIEIATAIRETVRVPERGQDGLSHIVLVPAAPVALPPVGKPVTQTLNWDRRYRHMRVHTALHLLSVVVPLPVTGGQIGAEKGRLDFDMPDPPADMAALEQALNGLVDRDLAVTEDWISEAALAANPGLIKTLSVQPPKGAGRVRLIRIGAGASQIDLQPCGGTHVARTGEIGRVRLGKIENKGRQNRRISVLLDN